MSDMNLLILGIVVFGFMLIGVVLTVLEFRRIAKKDQSGDGAISQSPGTAERSQYSG